LTIEVGVLAKLGYLNAMAVRKHGQAFEESPLLDPAYQL